MSKKTEIQRVPFKPKTKNQAECIRTIVESDISFVFGPAGSGKSFLSCNLGLEYLLTGKVEKLIIVKPAVEASKSLGYQPGNTYEKLLPYVQPLIYELDNSVTRIEIQKLIKEEKIVILSLGFLRGYNFNYSFIIGDEMTNATYKEIVLFLTRFGKGSKMVLTGDLKQSDLYLNDQGAMKIISDKIQDVKGIGIANLHYEDIIRHSIIGDILLKLK